MKFAYLWSCIGKGLRLMGLPRLVLAKVTTTSTVLTNSLVTVPKIFTPHTHTILHFNQLINRPDVAGAVLRTPLWLNDWLRWSSFSSKPSKYHKSQTVRARDLQFLNNIHHPLCVTCYMSCVKCHVSYIIYIFFFPQNVWTSRWRVCYQRGLPRLVY